MMSINPALVLFGIVATQTSVSAAARADEQDGPVDKPLIGQLYASSKADF